MYIGSPDGRDGDTHTHIHNTLTHTFFLEQVDAPHRPCPAGVEAHARAQRKQEDRNAVLSLERENGRHGGPELLVCAPPVRILPADR